MTETMHHIVNCETGETVARPHTDDELAQAETDRHMHAAREQAEADRQTAIANASTVEELKAALGLPTA